MVGQMKSGVKKKEHCAANVFSVEVKQISLKTKSKLCETRWRSCNKKCMKSERLLLHQSGCFTGVTLCETVLCGCVSDWVGVLCFPVKMFVLFKWRESGTKINFIHIFDAFNFQLHGSDSAFSPLLAYLCKPMLCVCSVGMLSFSVVVFFFSLSRLLFLFFIFPSAA